MTRCSKLPVPDSSFPPGLGAVQILPHHLLLYIVTLFFLFGSVSLQARTFNGLLNVQGAFFGSSMPISGDINTGTGTLQINPTAIYGVTASFLVTELLAPGTYTRTHNLSGGGSVTRTGTIPAGKSGAYLVVSHNGNEYQIFNAWTVSANGLNFSVHDIPGNTVVGGNLNNSRLRTSFSIPPLSLNISVNVQGGLDQECSEIGGNTVTADTTISGDLIADRIEWRIDGVYQGDGSSKSLFIPLGGANVEAKAFGSDGIATDSSSFFINVSDTTRPTLDIQFLDNLGNPVTSAQSGDFSISLITSDICDAAPTASGSATPVMDIVDGDVISISSPNDVRIPTTAVDVTATATDATGNRQVTQKMLLIQ